MSDPNPSDPRQEPDPAMAVRVRDLRVRIGGETVLEDVALDLPAGEVLGVVGASGAGKSVLLQAVLGLLRPEAGRVEVLGEDPLAAAAQERRRLQQRWGVAFQHAALFSSLTVVENVQVPLRHHYPLPPALLEEIAALRIGMVGLAPEAGAKLPGSLSGGMRKRAALARALATGPELLFVDEPTAGLDPAGASGLDALLAELRQVLGLSVFLVTHDLDSIHALCDRVVVLVDGRVVAAGTLDEVRAADHPWIRKSFHGPRGRRAAQQEAGS